jgi:hypothetical protein
MHLHSIAARSIITSAVGSTSCAGGTAGCWIYSDQAATAATTPGPSKAVSGCAPPLTGQNRTPKALAGHLSRHSSTAGTGSRRRTRHQRG